MRFGCNTRTCALPFPWIQALSPPPRLCPGHSNLQLSSGQCVWVHWVLSLGPAQRSWDCVGPSFPSPGLFLTPSHRTTSWPDLSPCLSPGRCPMPGAGAALLPPAALLLAAVVGWALAACPCPQNPQNPRTQWFPAPWSHGATDSQCVQTLSSLVY